MKESGAMLSPIGLVAVVGVLATALIWSENQVKEPASEKVVVTYWEKWTGFEGDAMRAVVDAFNKKQDRIFVKMLSVTAIQNKTNLATAGGIPPDVAGLFGPNVAQYVMGNLLEPLDDYIAESGISEKDYVPVYWDIGRIDGKQYALPSAPASTAYHYNKTHFRDAGLDPERPPKTIEELDQFAEKLTVRKDGKLVRTGFLPAEPGWWRDRWGYPFGAEMWDGKSKITADSPENIRAYTWVQTYSKKYGVQAISDFRSGFGNFSSPQNAFIDGKVSSVLQGVWMHNFIDKFNAGLEWGAAPFPHPADRPDLANGNYADMDILVIPRGAKHPKEAWEFIRYVQSQEGMELLCLGQQKHSPLAKVSDDFWTKSKNPYIRLFYDIAKSPNSKAPPKLAIWPEYSQEMNAAFDKINLDEDVKKSLAYVTQRMQPRLDWELRMKSAAEGGK